MSDVECNSQQKQTPTKFVPTFLDKEHRLDCADVGNNGLLLQNVYIPEEVLLHILSYVKPKELLNYSLVCRNWHRLIRSDILWFTIYERQYNRKAKKLPWYLYYCLLTTNYFDANLLANEDEVEHWGESAGIGQTFEPDLVLEQNANIRASELPVLFIKTKQSVAFRGWCGTGRRFYKHHWLIKFEKRQLLQHILDVYKPHISLTKWGSMYKLEYGLLGTDVSKCTVSSCCRTQTLGEPIFTEWLDLVLTQYPEGIQGILLKQSYNNQDTRNAKKGSAKLLFDSIEPITESKKFSTFEFISKKLPVKNFGI